MLVRRCLGDFPEALEQAFHKTRLQIPNFSLLHLALQGAILLSIFAMSYLKQAAAIRGGSHMALLSRYNSGTGMARSLPALGSERSLKTAALPLVQCEAAWSCHGQSSLINIPAFLTHAMVNSRLTGFRLDHKRALNICLKKHLSICIDLKEAKDTRSFPAGVKQQQEEDLSKPPFRSSYTLGIRC